MDKQLELFNAACCHGLSDIDILADDGLEEKHFHRPGWPPERRRAARCLIRAEL